MKNRLLYTLISLMIVSLIGIISIQGIWISGAIADSEDDFSARINDALNKVNDDIDQDEARFIIERTYGDVDSLIHEIVEFRGADNEGMKERLVIMEGNPEQHIEVNLERYEDRENQVDDHIEEVHANIAEAKQQMREWHERIDISIDDTDSVLESTYHVRELKDAKKQHIASMVNHFTFEKLLSGDLKDRISTKELKKKLTSSLKKEGIAGDFEFAVYNNDKNDFEEGYISDGFNKKQTEQNYRKMLFPSDRRKKSQFDLIVQSNSKSGFVWKGVQQMALLSGTFTILILLSFGYALYFIFKQKKISKIKNDFINNMTHELKTPLASISLASASINHPEVIGKPEEIRKFTSIIESEKHRINSHIERVLDIATLDKGDLKLDCHETDLISIIQSSLKNVNLSLTEIHGASTFTTDLDSASMKADEFHLTNVLTNVLDNSIKYRKNDLQIDIELKQSGGHYIISIKDNGIGMSSKEQGLAFDKFYRAESGNIHNSKGFGLGLSYVKGIVEQHHGTIALTSQKSIGTTVTIKLPMNNG